MTYTYFKPDSGYESLKREVFVFAARQLQTAYPQFVQAFQTELVRTSDFQSTYAQFEHLLGDRRRQPWRDLLTTVFEIDMVARKATDAMERMAEAVHDELRGEFYYHFDHWLFQVDALFDRCEGTIKKTARIILQLSDPTFKTWERDLTAELDELRTKITFQRNKLAHGLGGGVYGISRYWDGYLSIPGLDFTKTQELADTILTGVANTPTVETRARWYGGLSGEFSRSLAGLDDLCRRAAAAVAAEPAPVSRTACFLAIMPHRSPLCTAARNPQG